MLVVGSVNYSTLPFFHSRTCAIELVHDVRSTIKNDVCGENTCPLVCVQSYLGVADGGACM